MVRLNSCGSRHKRGMGTCAHSDYKKKWGDGEGLTKWETISSRRTLLHEVSASETQLGYIHDEAKRMFDWGKSTAFLGLLYSVSFCSFSVAGRTSTAHCRRLISISTEQWRNATNRGKPNYSEKTLSLSHAGYQKSHMFFVGLEIRSLH